MKKFILALAAVFCLATVPQANAQYYYHQYYKLSHPSEISASYGVSLLGSVMGSLANKTNFIGWLIDDDDYTVVSVGGSKGVVNLGYTYQINKTISVGGALGYNRMSVSMEDKTGKLTAASANIFTMMSTAKFDWFRTGNDMFGMYSKAGLGVMCINGELMEEEHLKGNIWAPAVHVSAIGMEVGKAFSGFMELGVGMQGIVQAGIRARF